MTDLAVYAVCMKKDGIYRSSEPCHYGMFKASPHDYGMNEIEAFMRHFEAAMGGKSLGDYVRSARKGMEKLCAPKVRRRWL